MPVQRVRSSRTASAGPSDPAGLSEGNRGRLSLIVAAAVDAESVDQSVRSELGPEDQLIVVVPPSNDDPRAAWEALGADVLVRSSTNLASAWAEGSARATGDFLAFCGPHLPQAGWLIPLIKALEDPDVGMVGPVVTGRDQPQGRAGGLAFKDAALNLRWLPPPSEPTAVPALAGYLLAMRSDTYREVGGWDTGADDGFSNLEMSLRLWRAGYSCVVAPDAEVRVPFVEPTAGVDWPRFLHNVVRIALSHLEDADLATSLASLKGERDFPEAMRLLLAGPAAPSPECALEPAGPLIRQLCGEIFDPAPTSAQTATPPTGRARSTTQRKKRGVSPSYREMNRDAWEYWSGPRSQVGHRASAEELAHAKDYLDPEGWLPWMKINRVLCLAAGGGWQGPLFAALGCEVTQFDLSPGQLHLDREVAAEHGLQIETVEGDMLDLSPLGGRKFDLVFQGISTCYVPRLADLYRQVASVLPKGGLYLVEHWNPLHLQLEGHGEWHQGAYRLSRPQAVEEPVPWVIPGTEADPVVTWHYIHPWQSLLGDLMPAGLAPLRLAENPPGDPAADPGSYEHLCAFAPAFYKVLARRTGRKSLDPSA